MKSVKKSGKAGSVFRAAVLIIFLAAEAAALCFLLSSPGISHYPPDEPAVLSFSRYGAACAGGLIAGAILLLLLKRKEISTPLLLSFQVFCMPLSLLCARLLYCLARAGEYFSGSSAVGVLYVQNGGYMMWGVFAGALLSSLICAKISGKQGDAFPGLKALLNAAVPSLLIFILFERAGEYFTGYGRGLKLKPGESGLCFLPLFSPVLKSGKVFRWELSVWFLEGAFALILLIAYFLRKKDRHAFISALTLYSAGQIIFESLLSSDCPKWGFVKVNMVLGGAVLLLLTALPLLRKKKRRACLLRCGICLVLLAVCGTGEWALDKVDFIPNAVIYGIMALCCALCAGNVLNIWNRAEEPDTGR